MTTKRPAGEHPYRAARDFADLTNESSHELIFIEWGPSTRVPMCPYLVKQAAAQYPKVGRKCVGVLPVSMHMSGELTESVWTTVVLETGVRVSELDVCLRTSGVRRNHVELGHQLPLPTWNLNTISVTPINGLRDTWRERPATRQSLTVRQYVKPDTGEIFARTDRNNVRPALPEEIP